MLYEIRYNGDQKFQEASMAIRSFCSSSAYVRPCYISTFSRCGRPHAQLRMAKAMKSTMRDYHDVQKLFDDNRFIEIPPRGWKERFIVIADESNHTSLHSHAQSDPVLTFDDFKRQRLKSFDEYKNEHKKYYDDETIRKGYEGYCRGCYKSYLIEREQINPGIIF
jgi:hypothetical protein